MYQILQNASALAIAVDTEEIVGFVYAISDDILAAYIPLLEVKAAWRGQKIASKLMQLLMTELDGLYMIDTSCDDDVVRFYQQLGFMQGNAMIRRNYKCQSGKTIL